MRILPLPLILALAACECLPIPSTDTSPPTAGLIVEFRPVGGGPRTTVTVSPTDSDVTVQAAKNDTVAVVYSGGDPQGIRRVDLDYDMSYSTGTTIVRPLLAAINVTSDCPRNPFTGAKNFDASNNPWVYTFASSATNWLGANTKSAKVTVRTQ